MRIQSSGAGASTLLGGQTHSPVGKAQTNPMAELLFGKKPPKLVPRNRHPGLKKGLRKLDGFKEHLTAMMGRRDEDFPLCLCEGENAFISRDGTLAFGVELLAEHQDDDDLLLGILGHELGHQPWTWPKGSMASLTKKLLKVMYREEEAKADRFAGGVLAEFDASPEPIAEFLLEHEKGFEAAQLAASDYYPATVRAKMIRDAWSRKRARLKARTTLARR